MSTLKSTKIGLITLTFLSSLMSTTLLIKVIIKTLSVNAAGEPLLISAPVTLGDGNTITANMFVDSTGGSAYYVDPAGTKSVFAGNIGIGTTAPLSPLSVGGIGDTAYGIYGIGNTGIYGESNLAGGVGVKGIAPLGGVSVYGQSGSVYGGLGASGVSGGSWTDAGVYGSGPIGVEAEGAGSGIGLMATNSATAVRAHGTAFDFYGTGPTSYFTGNVGIGTTAPGAKLDIVGDGTNYALEANNTSTGDGYRLYTADAIANNGIVWTQGAINLLNVYSTASNQGMLVLYDGQTGSAVADVKFTTDGTDSYINSGQFGLGITGPLYELDVVGDTRVSEHLGLSGSLPSANWSIYADETYTNTTSVGGIQTLNRTYTTGASATHTTYGSLTYGMAYPASGYSNTGSAYGTYTTGGNYDVGTLTNAYGTYSIVNNNTTGTITTAFGLRSLVNNATTGAITTGYGLYIDDVESTTQWGIYQAGSTDENYFGGNTGIKNVAPSVALDVTGDIEYTGTITDVSDSRLKENIIPISNSLTKILSLNGYKYNMIGKKTTDIELGYKAQDVQMVLPELVSIIDPKNGYLGVNYIGIIPVITEAIKEQQNEISRLSTQLSAQQKQIDELKQAVEAFKSK